MPDIISVLERAAAAPTQEPDVDRAVRAAWRARVAAAAVASVVVATITLSGYVALRPSSPRHRVTVSGPPPAASTTIPRPLEPNYRDAKNGFEIAIFGGWKRSNGTLEPWLYSPHEILSVATVALAPSPLPGNQAACASEVPKVAVDGIGRAGAFMGIYEWRKGQGLYTAEAWRGGSSAHLAWGPGCKLTTGATVSIATFELGGRDFTVSTVVGPDAVSARAEIYGMLDAFALQPTAAEVIPPAVLTPTSPLGLSKVPASRSPSPSFITR